MTVKKLKLKLNLLYLTRTKRKSSEIATPSMQHSDTEENAVEPEGPRPTKRQTRRDWQHDTQYGWDMYSSQDSDISRVPCSQPESQEDIPVTQVQRVPFDPPNFHNRVIVVPDTPTDEPEPKIEKISKDLEEEGYTVMQHKMQDGRIMHLAFKLYPQDTV